MVALSALTHSEWLSLQESLISMKALGAPCLMQSAMLCNRLSAT